MFHPLINLLVVLLSIIILIRLRLQLGLVMLGAGVLCGLLFRVSGFGLLQTLWRAFYSPIFLQLGTALVMIMFLEQVLRTKGYLEKALNSLRVLLPDPKWNIMIIPAFLGLLPSPGGAVLSAPLVSEAGAGLIMSGETKSLVNLWFRHVWEYFIPLYPEIILVAQMLAAPVGKIALILSSCFPIIIIIGYFMIIRPIKKTREALSSQANAVIGKRRAVADLAAGVWPIVLIVAIVLVFKIDVGLTVLAVLLFLLWNNKYRLPELKELCRKSFRFSILLLIIGILFFKEMLFTAGVIDWLPEYLHSMGAPVLLIAATLPFILGVSMGLPQGFVVTAFPLLTGIIGTGEALKPGMLILAYMSGFIGVTLTPLHLCFTLTVKYNQCNFTKVWRMFLIPVALLGTMAFLAGYVWQ